MCVCPLLSAEILKISRREGPVCSCRALLFGPLGPTFFLFFCSVPVHVLTLALVIVYIRPLLFLMMMIGGGDSRVCANDYSFLLCHVLLFPSSLSSGKQIIIIIRPSTSTRVLVLCHCCNYSRVLYLGVRLLLLLQQHWLSYQSILLLFTFSFSDLGAFSFCYSVCSLCLLLSSLQL